VQQLADITPILHNNAEESSSTVSISLPQDSGIMNLITDEQLSEIEWNEIRTHDNPPISEEGSNILSSEEMAVSPSFVEVEDVNPFHTNTSRVSYMVSLLPESSCDVSSQLYNSKSAIHRA
jgi:hypothetical protein